jgi:uncharacterized membrane protein (UPF0127 family)
MSACLKRQTHRKFYVYNETRQSFLSLGVNVADTHFTSLKGLLGKKQLNGDEGLWVVPSQGIHTIGVLFPIDVIYLDANRKVIHLVEHLAPFRIGPLRIACDSVLELPARTIYTSQTQIGDSFSISSSGQSGNPLGTEAGARSWYELLGHGWRPLRYVRKWLSAWIASLKDRREYRRLSVPLVAYYWNGGAARACQVNAVSPVGAYIVTPDRWYPGTILRLTFQHAKAHVGGAETAVMVRAKLVRCGPDGVGVRLIYLNQAERRNFDKFLAAALVRGG